MNGQWLGYLTNLQKDGKILDIQQSFVVLNLDLNGQSFEGRVMLFSLNNRNWMAAQVKINKKTLTNTREYSQENCLTLIRLKRILLLEVGKKKNSLIFQKLRYQKPVNLVEIVGRRMLVNLKLMGDLKQVKLMKENVI